MKKLFASFGWLMLLLPLISVAGARTVISTIGAGTGSTEDRQVAGFNGISSGGAFDVFVTMGSKESLRLEGDQDEISRVETVVEKGILKIRYKKDPKLGWFNSRNKVNVYITAKMLNSLMLSGSGNMKIEGTVKAAKLDTKVSGSGNISANVATEKLTSIVSGSGSLSLSGTTASAEVLVSGSGNFRGRELHAITANVKVSGSGNAGIHADNSIQAVVSGSGNIGFSGNAKNITKVKSGSGSISRL